VNASDARARGRCRRCINDSAVIETMEECASDAPRGVTASERVMFAVVAPIFALSFQLSVFFSTDGLRLDRRQRRTPGFEWAKFMSRGVTGTRLKLVPGSAALCREKRKTVYLCNHRAWSDFFLDMYVTEGRAFTMSRLLVAYAFPLFMVPAMVSGTVFGFKRDGGDYEKLNASLDAHFEKFGGEFTGMVCYPEGTRNIKPQSKPLKRGMLRYAYSRKMAVQVICTARKERVFSSHLYCAERNLALPMYVTEVIQAEDYTDFEDFYNEIRSKWDDAWCEANRVNEKDVESLPDYVPRERVVACTNRHDALVASSALCAVIGVALAWRATSRFWGY